MSSKFQWEGYGQDTPPHGRDGPFDYENKNIHLDLGDPTAHYSHGKIDEYQDQQFKMDGTPHAVHEFRPTQDAAPGQTPPPQPSVHTDYPRAQDSNSLISDYDPKLHYSRYKPGTARNIVDMAVLIAIPVVSFIAVVHAPKYILEGAGMERSPDKPDSFLFIFLYAVLTILFTIVLTLLIAYPLGRYKYIVGKFKKLNPFAGK